MIRRLLKRLRLKWALHRLKRAFRAHIQGLPQAPTCVLSPCEREEKSSDDPDGLGGILCPPEFVAEYERAMDARRPIGESTRTGRGEQEQEKEPNA